MPVRRKYQRDRAKLAPDADKLQVYIRPDQMVWLREETLRRLDGSPLTRRTSRFSELAREAIDLLIEYTRHKEFMEIKAAGRRAGHRLDAVEAPVVPADIYKIVTPAAVAAAPLAIPLASGPAARSQESAAPGPPSSGNSGRS